jgi:FAD/FMN-containing dehydrogenase
MTPLPPPFLEALGGFPADFASSDAGDLRAYGTDRTRVHEPRPSLLVRPRSTDEVSRFVALCSKYGVPIVPSGGRTGLAGGAVAARGEVVVSLERMRRMDPVDVAGQSVRVQAGAVTEAVHVHAGAHGLTWPVDFASKGSSTVGGNVATNAGGVRVIRYGLTREWVLGLEVVTPTGVVLELGGALEKNNTGLDLRQLYIGSEGTLGIVTEATLKLTRLPGPTHVALLAVDGLAGALRLLERARGGPFVVAAFEFFTDACLARVMRHRGFDAPFRGARPAGYVLLEVEHESRGDVETWLEDALETAGAANGMLAQNTAQAKRLWAYREDISESLAATGLPHKNDVALPVAALGSFADDLGALLSSRYPGYELCLFGHVGDGNLHINVMKPDAMSASDFHATTREADHALFELVRRHRGSISAEHGIGLLKKDFLGYSRSEEEVRVMRAVKLALDPAGILNPGKVLDG